jgi:hypothetical protein
LGDFNLIRSPDNRNKGGGNPNEMMLFNDLILHLDLIDISFQGRNFSWSNMQYNALLEKLNWLFTSTSWTLSFPSTKVMPLSRRVSEIPYVIQIGTCIPKAHGFKFENYWVDFSGFHETVKLHWDFNPFHSNFANTISRKFK